MLSRYDELFTRFDNGYTQRLTRIAHSWREAGRELTRAEWHLVTIEEQLDAAKKAELVYLVLPRIRELQQTPSAEFRRKGICSEPFIGAYLDNDKVSVFPDTGACANSMSLN